jgi:hypothetical protein
MVDWEQLHPISQGPSAATSTWYSLEVVFNKISPAIFYITAFELSDGRGNLKY